MFLRIFGSFKVRKNSGHKTANPQTNLGKSASFRICDFRNLFADPPPLLITMQQVWKSLQILLRDPSRFTVSATEARIFYPWKNQFLPGSSIKGTVRPD